MLMIIFLMFILTLLFLAQDHEKTAQPWEAYCNLECIERRTSKKCCEY